MTIVFFYGSCFGHAVQQVNLVYLSSTLDQHCPPSTINLRSRDKDNPWSLLFVPDKAT